MGRERPDVARVESQAVCPCLVRSLESSSRYSPESMKEVKVFIGKTEVTMKPEGEDVTVKVNGSPINVPMTERKTIKGEEGHIVAKISK